MAEKSLFQEIADSKLGNPVQNKLGLEAAQSLSQVETATVVKRQLSSQIQPQFESRYKEPSKGAYSEYSLSDWKFLRGTNGQIAVLKEDERASVAVRKDDLGVDNQGRSVIGLSFRRSVDDAQSETRIVMHDQGNGKFLAMENIFVFNPSEANYRVSESDILAGSKDDSAMQTNLKQLADPNNPENQFLQSKMTELSAKLGAVGIAQVGSTVYEPKLDPAPIFTPQVPQMAPEQTVQQAPQQGQMSPQQIEQMLNQVEQPMQQMQQPVQGQQFIPQPHNSYPHYNNSLPIKIPTTSQRSGSYNNIYGQQVIPPRPAGGIYNQYLPNRIPTTSQRHDYVTGAQQVQQPTQQWQQPMQQIQQPAQQWQQPMQQIQQPAQQWQQPMQQIQQPAQQWQQPMQQIQQPAQQWQQPMQQMQQPAQQWQQPMQQMQQPMQQMQQFQGQQGYQGEVPMAPKQSLGNKLMNGLGQFMGAAGYGYYRNGTGPTNDGSRYHHIPVGPGPVRPQFPSTQYGNPYAQQKDVNAILNAKRDRLIQQGRLPQPVYGDGSNSTKSDTYGEILPQQQR